MKTFLIRLPLLIAAFALPASAFAHITVDPREAPAASYAKLVFRVPHGCDGSPTVKITVEIPDGVLGVKPQVHPGWKIGIRKKKLAKPAMLFGDQVTETVSEISWKGGPLPDEYMDEFGMSAKLPNEPGQKLLFPVTQECEKGTFHWSSANPSGHGDHAAQLPAPVLTLTQPMAHMEHHEGH